MNECRRVNETNVPSFPFFTNFLFPTPHSSSILPRSVEWPQFDRVKQKVNSSVHGPDLRPSHIYEVCPSPHSVAEEKFRKHAAENNQSTVHAYHGSKIESFHSILNYGLQQHLCKVSSIRTLSPRTLPPISKYPFLFRIAERPIRRWDLSVIGITRQHALQSNR